METLQQWENEALLVDDLLDFSCGDIGEGDDCVVTCIPDKETDSSCAANCCEEGRASPGSSDGRDCLYSPPEEQADLEWLSRFVEESYKGADNSLPLVTSDEWFSTGPRKERCLKTSGWEGKRTTSWLRMGASSQILDVGSSPLIETPACWPLQQCKREWDKRSRSKRSSRSGGRVWSLQRVMRSNEDEDQEEDNDQEASSLDYEPYPRSPSKFPCKKAKKASASGCNTMEEGRRCSHCQVQKTPQWRAGPLGPKTLCNACGVRYKSGRLLPEYRPAASPTFVSELHSNSHKKVIEMRTFKACVAQELDQDEFSSCSQESSTSLRV